MIRFGCCSRLLLVSFFFASFCGSLCSARGEVRLPHMLSDHAVLQRQIPVHIWGWAEAGEKVTVSFHGQTQMGVADDLGRWSVHLRPEQAGGPYVLTFRGNNTIRREDILVGDVWFASGQSNMEFPLNGFPGNGVLKNWPEEIAAASP